MQKKIPLLDVYKEAGRLVKRKQNKDEENNMRNEWYHALRKTFTGIEKWSEMERDTRNIIQNVKSFSNDINKTVWRTICRIGFVRSLQWNCLQKYLKVIADQYETDMIQTRIFPNNKRPCSSSLLSLKLSLTSSIFPFLLYRRIRKINVSQSSPNAHKHI